MKRFIFVAGIVVVVLLVAVGRAEMHADVHRAVSQGLELTGTIVDFVKYLVGVVTAK